MFQAGFLAACIHPPTITLHAECGIIPAICTKFPYFLIYLLLSWIEVCPLSQCHSCSDCEGHKAQDPPCSSPWCQESKQLHFHHYSTSPAPHNASTQVETSLSPNSITFSGRKAVSSGVFCEHVTTHQDIQEVCSTGHFFHAWIQGSLMLLGFICWGTLGNNDNLKINNFDIPISSLG